MVFLTGGSSKKYRRCRSWFCRGKFKAFEPIKSKNSCDIWIMLFASSSCWSSQFIFPPRHICLCRQINKSSDFVLLKPFLMYGLDYNLCDFFIWKAAWNFRLHGVYLMSCRVIVSYPSKRPNRKEVQPSDVCRSVAARKHNALDVGSTGFGFFTHSAENLSLPSFSTV